MIFDCVMFNDELDILELRLNYMYQHIDFFVIAESAITHTGLTKPLHFSENRERFSKFNDKIIHVIIPPVDQHDSWKGEFYQRDYIRTALKNCKSDDLIIIADVDEIVNMEYIKKHYSITSPVIIDTPMFYYFFNLKTKVRWQLTMITPYRFIEDFNIGNRLDHKLLNPTIIKGDNEELGWHFSYLFGYNIALYQSKLRSFSHAEYSSDYFLDGKRIKTCLHLAVDFLERYSIYLKVKFNKEFPPALLASIRKIYNLDDVIYKNPGVGFYLIPYNFKYFLKLVVKLKLAILRERIIPTQQ